MSYFDNVSAISIPEGDVAIISRGDEILWREQKYKRELGYLENTGTQWINTEYIPGSKTAIEMVVSGISADSFSVSSGTWFTGARVAYLNRAFGFYYSPADKKMYYAFGNSMLSGSYTSLYGDVKKIYADATGLYIGDAKVASANASSFTAPVPLPLFGLNNNGSVFSHTKYKLHSCKLWEDGVLIRDYIPVLDWNDVPCLYDKVNKKLYYNQGAGEFAYGGDVV